MAARRSVGIVREAYSRWERRAPFTPEQVKRIVDKLGVEVRVQPSGKRVFTDQQYVAAGATVTDDLSPCNAIFGVKQVPIPELLDNKTYLFFSHVIKAQLENMPLMDELLRKNVRLIDYECITRGGQPGAPRLVAFGEYAGKAGFIDTLRGVGQQLLYKGVSSSFLNVGSAYMYPSYAAASRAVAAAGESFVEDSRGQDPTKLNPLIFLFTGSGNVNRGARQVFNLMPHTWVDPDEFPQFAANPSTDAPIVGCQVELRHMVERVADGGFDKQEYYAHPELYRSKFFEQYAMHSNVLINGGYWDARYPRVISKNELRHGAANGSRLHFISDISCDIGGGIESLHDSTEIEDPFLMVKDPAEASDVMMLGVDILPSELPREASQHFGDYLFPFVAELASGADTEALAPELQGACILEKGSLRGRFGYISKMRTEKLRELNGLSASNEELTQLQLEGSTVVRIEGHLFDTGLINSALDVVEEKQGRFHILECLVGPNRKTSLLLQISMDQGRPQVEEVLTHIRTLLENPEAEAEMEEMPQTFCQGDFRATLQQKDGSAAASAEQTASTATKLERTLSWAPLQTVAVLGAGMVTRPCVELLSRNTSRNVVVCSAMAGEAERLANSIGRSNIQPALLDAVKDRDELAKLVGRCDAVISLLPATMHHKVAELCIENGTPLVTASYVSPAMKELDAAARERGVPILGEMGLDPGMDHMSAQEIIDRIHREGRDVTAFESVCGGLVAPEAADNPFGYKFSWSPIGVINAMKNDALFLKDGKRVSVSGGAPLLEAAEPFRVHQLPSLALEQLPNRDSIKYADTYNIPEAKTCFRGTLRYQGFSHIVARMLRAGMTEEDLVFKDTLARFREANPTGSGPAADAMEWLLAGDVLTAELESGSSLQSLATLLQQKLALREGERDLCVMQHTFNDGEEFSTLLAFGDGKDTGMARTVGLTVAIGAELFLDRTPELEGASGVLMPTESRIYEPALKRLAEEGLVFQHHVKAR